jgi:predicted nucleic acid-binding protein
MKTSEPPLLACLDANVFLDGLYLATALAEHADLLITTDPHLLGVTELKAIPPSQYRV